MSITDILYGKGVTSATLIDDAFDPISAMVSLEDIRSFWSELEQNEQLSKELTTLGITITSQNDVNDATLQRLFDAYEALRTFEVIKALFGRAVQIRSEAQTIKANLEELRIEVSVAGKSTQVAKTECKLYFVDYYLGPRDMPTQAVAAAVAQAKEIYSQHADPERKPLIILMSSNPLTDQQVVEFRKASGLLGGMFHHIPKSQLIDRDAIQRKLLAVTKSFPIAYAIEALISSVEKSYDASREVFFSALRDLSLEDYIYIQRLSLKEDGQPFGDYLLWLFSSGLVKQVFENENVAQQQLVVDKLPMLDLPARQLAPSKHLAEMYRSALFKVTNPDVEPHPLSSVGKNYPLLSLGDIFVSADSKLLMVINAECDLAFAPQSEGRPFSASKSVTMISGTLFPLNKSLPAELGGRPRTELFVHQGDTFQIVWDTKRVVTKDYGEIRPWIDANNLKRNYRLRLLYALQVQHAYTSDFGRIGPPTAPPIFSPVHVEIWSLDENGRSTLVLGPLTSEAALIRLSGEPKCAVDLSFLEQLCAIIPSTRKKLQGRRDALAAPPQLPEGAVEPETDHAQAQAKAEKLARKIERLDTQLTAIDEFLSDKVQQIELISNPFELPEHGTPGEKTVGKGLLRVYNNREVERNYQVPEPFIIRLLDPETGDGAKQHDEASATVPNPPQVPSGNAEG